MNSNLKLGITSDRRCFTREGRPFFWLADTVWGAFGAIDFTEWEEYLTYRAMQGYNVLQISILPILHDTTEHSDALQPFHVHSDGSWDFNSFNEAYLQKACTMLELACRKGFTPALVLLWCSYLEGSWLANGPGQIMPPNAVKPYVERIVREFQSFHPVYLVSGDTDFANDGMIQAYRTALQSVKELDSKALTTLHLQASGRVPDELLRMQELDFVMYQSGHILEEQDRTYMLAERHVQEGPTRPVLNSEPCYEGHGHGNRYGRFTAFDVRRAFWSSVLSGASAGFSYGAHGVWSWQRPAGQFNNDKWSKKPMLWQEALRFPGAWDVSFGKWLLQQKIRGPITAAQELLITPYEGIRAGLSAGGDLLAVYIPYANDVQMDLDLGEYELTLFLLSSRYPIMATVEVSNGQSVLRMPSYNEDMLLLATRPEP